MKAVDIEDVSKQIVSKYKLGCEAFDRSKGITVNALCIECMKLVAEGNGNKHIQISMDDEGNAFHTLFYTFTQKDLDMFDYHDDVDLKDVVLLG